MPTDWETEIIDWADYENDLAEESYKATAGKKPPMAPTASVPDRKFPIQQLVNTGHTESPVSSTSTSITQPWTGITNSAAYNNNNNHYHPTSPTIPELTHLLAALQRELEQTRSQVSFLHGQNAVAFNQIAADGQQIMELKETIARDSAELKRQRAVADRLRERCSRLNRKYDAVLVEKRQAVDQKVVVVREAVHLRKMVQRLEGDKQALVGGVAAAGRGDGGEGMDMDIRD
ncbi:hypothetical protein BJX61DRAFT_546830 [Aspergillus egyptiacus]|nr:hypothetical protein BJX61DRAFT_546830 [Aspergillus egyptiacus]